MGLKRGIASFEWRCAYERVKEGGKKTTDRLFTAGAHRTTGRFVELFSPLSLCASAFVIFSAEKKRKEKGEKKKNRTAPRYGNSTNNDEFNLF